MTVILLIMNPTTFSWVHNQKEKLSLRSYLIGRQRGIMRAQFRAPFIKSSTFYVYIFLLLFINLFKYFIHDFVCIHIFYTVLLLFFSCFSKSNMWSFLTNVLVMNIEYWYCWILNNKYWFCLAGPPGRRGRRGRKGDLGLSGNPVRN